MRSVFCVLSSVGSGVPCSALTMVDASPWESSTAEKLLLVRSHQMLQLRTLAHNSASARPTEGGPGQPSVSGATPGQGGATKSDGQGGSERLVGFGGGRVGAATLLPGSNAGSVKRRKLGIPRGRTLGELKGSVLRGVRPRGRAKQEVALEGKSAKSGRGLKGSVLRRVALRGRLKQEGALEGGKGQEQKQERVPGSSQEKRGHGGKAATRGRGRLLQGVGSQIWSGVAPRGSGMVQVNIQSAKSKDLAAVVQSNAQTQDSGSFGALGGTGPTVTPTVAPVVNSIPVGVAQTAAAAATAITTPNLGGLSGLGGLGLGGLGLGTGGLGIGGLGSIGGLGGVGGLGGGGGLGGLGGLGGIGGLGGLGGLGGIGPGAVGAGVLPAAAALPIVAGAAGALSAGAASAASGGVISPTVTPTVNSAGALGGLGGASSPTSSSP